VDSTYWRHSIERRIRRGRGQILKAKNGGGSRRSRGKPRDLASFMENKGERMMPEKFGARLLMAAPALNQLKGYFTRGGAAKGFTRPKKGGRNK